MPAPLPLVRFVVVLVCYPCVASGHWSLVCTEEEREAPAVRQSGAPDSESGGMVVVMVGRA